MNNIRKNLCGIFFATIVLTCFFLSTVFAENEKQEGIFIEAVSEMRNGLLTLDEVRTRPTTVSASSKKIAIEADGYYISDVNLGENPHVAQDRARADAKRILSEQATVYVKSVSESRKTRLTRDEIYTVSVTVLQIKNEFITTEALKDSAVQYHCHINALLDTSNIFDELSPIDKEKFGETVRRTVEIERESARLNSELAALKQKYKNASKSEREKIYAEIRQNEQLFTATMWSEKGFELYNQNDLNGATECLKKAVEFDPGYVSAWNELGYIANYQRNFDKAVEYCYKAIELNPDYAAAWNNLGYSYSCKGVLDKALECYKKAIALEPNNIIMQVNLANLYVKLENYDTAFQCYQKALELAPDSAEVFNGLGYVYMQKNDFDNGIIFCQKAVESDPHYAAAWNGLGYAYNQKKKFYKAIECCRKAVGLNKNYANAWNNLGYACSKVHRHEDSFTAYSRAVKIAPNIQLYRNNLNIARERIESFKSL